MVTGGGNSGKGQYSTLERSKREILVKYNKACFYTPYRNVEQAAQRAGLP
jgi:hypothetical protein